MSLLYQFVFLYFSLCKNDYNLVIFGCIFMDDYMSSVALFDTPSVCLCN
jgi:hypothetical protein